MRKSLFVFSLIVLTSLLGLAVAQQKPEPKPDESAQTAGKVLTGDVVTVDATKNEIVIKNDGGMEVHISVGASTKFFRGDKAIALADVKVGDKLTCECENSGEGCKAKGIVVTSPTQVSNSIPCGVRLLKPEAASGFSFQAANSIG